MPHHSTPTPTPSSPLLKTDTSASDIKQAWDTFLVWEKHTSDSVDFKCIYADIAGDVVAGLFLSQLLFWCQPSKSGAYKMADKEGMWIAKERSDWYAECRLSVKQVARSTKILKASGIIKTRTARFQRRTIQHIQLQHQAFLNAWHAHRLRLGKD
jgi:hypothetical protein